jgi:hypothetical protein
VTLVAQRATEVTDIPGVPLQSEWVRPEGGAPGEKRASGYEPFDRSAASRPGLPGAVRAVPVASAGAVQIPREHPYGIHDPAAALRLPAS